MMMHDIEKGFSEPYNLADHLPYGEYLDGVFLMVDGSVGQVWELTLPGTEGMGQEALAGLSQGLSGFLGRLPAGLHLQFMVVSDRDIEGFMARYRTLASGREDAVVTRINDSKIGHMKAGARGEWKRDDEEFTPKRLRAFLTVRTFPSWSPGAAQAGVNVCPVGDAAVEARLAADWARIRAAWTRVTGMVESQLQSLGIGYAALDGNGLMGLLYRLLNPQRARQVPAPALRRGMIRDQLLFHAPVARGNGFILDGGTSRVVSLKELPGATTPGMFAPSGGLLDVHPQMMVVMNFVVPDQGDALNRLKFQKAFAFVQRSSSMGDVSEEAVHKKEELSALITEIFKSGRVIVQARMHIVLWDKEESVLERACDDLMLQLHRFGAEGLKEEIIAPSLFLTCLPLNFDHGLENFVRRERRLLSDNFADMLPVYGAMQGTRTPAAMYLDRRGVPVGVDFFDSETNPHGVIVGASGAGKSFFTNDLIYQNYRLGAHFFVLDKGHSYRKTCEVLGGQYIHFDLNAPLTINPFAAEPTNENLAFLVEVLALMASGGDERDRLAREEKGFLQQAVVAAYGHVTGREVTLSDVVGQLKGEMGERLALRLAPFTRRGPYGKFFDGENAFTVGKRFTVFELAQLSAYPDLQLVVLLNIMFFVTRFVASEDMKPLRKFLLIDEAWQLLKMSHTSDFITNAFKTFRKYRCATLAITQEVSDLLQQKSGMAILANAANKIFLKQEASVIAPLCRELALSGEIAALLGSVRTVKGRYSEALVMTPSSTGVVRLMPDPLLYWAATSEPRDNAALAEARGLGEGQLLPALEACALRYPYGVQGEAR